MISLHGFLIKFPSWFLYKSIIRRVTFMADYPCEQAQSAIYFMARMMHGFNKPAPK